MLLSILEKYLTKYLTEYKMQVKGENQWFPRNIIYLIRNCVKEILLVPKEV